MNQQTTLTNYFKSIAFRGSSPAQAKSSKSNDKNIRRSLSLKKPLTTSKSPKETSKEVVLMDKQEDIITLSSDGESEGPTPSKRQHVGARSSKSQDETVHTVERAPSPEPALVSAQSPMSTTSNHSVTNFVYNLSPGIVCQSPRTPKSSSSPGSSGNFYSPTKKRIVKKISPVKRNLAAQFNENIASESFVEEKHTTKIYQDRDDKTDFLLSIIHKYLNTASVKHLLGEDSQVLLEKCMHVAHPGMRLMCRLYWRQHSWYRMEELGQIASGKKEVLSSPDLYNMIMTLVGHGLITSAEPEGEKAMDIDDYVKLLKKPELQQICKELKLKIQSKQNAVDALKSFCKLQPISNFYTGNVKNNHTRVLEILKSKSGHCYKMSELAINTFYELYVLMYLGIDYSVIRDKKLEWILIHDKINRETYPIDKAMDVDNASVVFQDREEFQRYIQAHKMYENYIEKTDANEKCEIVVQSYNLYKEVEAVLRYKSLPVWLRRFTPPNIYVKILENGVQELKKLKKEECYQLAVNILDTLIDQIAFRQHKKAEWFAEKALILHKHLDSSTKAANALLEGFKSDLSEQAKDAMRPRAKKIAQQQNIDLNVELREALLSHVTHDAILESNLPGDHIYKLPIDNYNQRGKLKFEAYTTEGKTTLTAENYCVFHYVSYGQYTHGEHWEGRIVTTLFFLLFWDIIYAKPPGVTGVFLSHYQRHPLDMYSDAFYVNRKTIIDERLSFIEECTDELLMAMLQSKWSERPDCEISDIQRSIGWESVRMVTSCLRPRGVAALCRRLASNYGYTHSGFPDLTLWNVKTNKIKFVEVKTDADKPSVKQLQWLQYLTEHGIDAGFCYVGVNTTRSRARAGIDSASSSQSLS